SGLRFDFVAGWWRKCLIRLAVRFCCRMAAQMPYPAYGSILLPDGGANALSGLRFYFDAGWGCKCLIRPTVGF
ncbi:hypothetical protein, partial [Citrobacter koseri]|uniref:hypothetical protein n=1 Tax=Citrobacter koseri TaxID=545 RepID=UPI0039BF1138